MQYDMRRSFTFDFGTDKEGSVGNSTT